MACGDAAQDIKAWQNHEPELGLYSVISRSFWGFPPFHAAGFAAGLRDSVFYDTTIALPAPNRILDTEAFVEILGSTAFDSVALLPHQVEDIARSPEALKLIERLKCVIWAGGELPFSGPTQVCSNFDQDPFLNKPEIESRLIRKQPDLPFGHPKLIHLP